MQIVVIEKNKKKIHLHLPLFLLKSSLVTSHLKGCKIDKKVLKKMYKALRNYKKHHGQLTFIEVISSNNEIVKIIV